MVLDLIVMVRHSISTQTQYTYCTDSAEYKYTDRVHIHRHSTYTVQTISTEYKYTDIVHIHRHSRHTVQTVSTEYKYTDTVHGEVPCVLLMNIECAL